MLGKAKCKILKEIRQKIADENDIPYVTRECTYQGDCSGTCPRCESELRYLERELEVRRNLGKQVAVTALCTGISLGTVACSLPGNSSNGQLSGDVTYNEPEQVELTGVEEPLGGETQLSGDVSIEPVEGELEYEPELAGEVEDWSGCEKSSGEGEIVKTDDTAFDGLFSFAGTVNTEGVYNSARYCPLFTPDKDVKLCALTTHHWNESLGAAPGCIRIYDVTDGEEVLLGTWEATARDAEYVENVYWDIFPDITLEAGHTYHIVDSDPETWSTNMTSEEMGFVELFTDEEIDMDGVFAPCYR